MNEQQILDTVARKGRLRAVQLSDWLDVPVEDARAQLMALVAVGDLVATDGFAPNGRADVYFDLSDAFRASDAGVLLTRKAEAANFGDPSMSKVDRAIAFVREKGTATSSELHALLELKPEQTASTWLAGALRDGRLVRDGKNWTVGTGVAPKVQPVQRTPFNRRPISNKSEPVAQFPSTAPIEVPQFLADRATVASKPSGKKAPETLPASEDLAGLPKALVQELSKPAQARAAATHVNIDERDAITVDGSLVVDGKVDMAPLPAFRAGLWSDGTLELQRDGKTIAKLQQSEGELLAEFMHRMRARLAA